MGLQRVGHVRATEQQRLPSPLHQAALTSALLGRAHSQAFVVRASVAVAGHSVHVGGGGSSDRAQTTGGDVLAGPQWPGMPGRRDLTC